MAFEEQETAIVILYPAIKLLHHKVVKRSRITTILRYMNYITFGKWLLKVRRRQHHHSPNSFTPSPSWCLSGRLRQSCREGDKSTAMLTHVHHVTLNNTLTYENCNMTLAMCVSVLHNNTGTYQMLNTSTYNLHV